MRVPSLSTGLKAKLADLRKVRYLLADNRVHGLVTTTTVVHLLNIGYQFQVTDVKEVSNDSTQKWLFQTPSGEKRVYLIVDIEGTGELTYEFYEGSTHTGDTELNIYNNNRNSDNTSDCTAYAGATGGDDGTMIATKRFGQTGAGKQGTPMVDRGYVAWVLKPDTKYVISATAANDIHISLQLEFTEFIDKD